MMYGFLSFTMYLVRCGFGVWLLYFIMGGVKSTLSDCVRYLRFAYFDAFWFGDLVEFDSLSNYGLVSCPISFGT